MTRRQIGKVGEESFALVDWSDDLVQWPCVRPHMVTPGGFGLDSCLQSQGSRWKTSNWPAKRKPTSVRQQFMFHLSPQQLQRTRGLLADTCSSFVQFSTVPDSSCKGYTHSIVTCDCRTPNPLSPPTEEWPFKTRLYVQLCIYYILVELPAPSNRSPTTYHFYVCKSHHFGDLFFS